MFFGGQIVQLKNSNKIGKIVGYNSQDKIYKIKIAQATYILAKEDEIDGSYAKFLELNKS